METDLEVNEYDFTAYLKKEYESWSRVQIEVPSKDTNKIKVFLILFC